MALKHIYTSIHIYIHTHVLYIHAYISLPEVLRVGNTFIQDAVFALEPLNLQLEQVDVFHPLSVVEVTFPQD